VVAPERLTRGELQFGAGFAGSRSRLLHAAPWLTNAVQAWEALNAWWQDDFVGFNYLRQIDFARWLGIGAAGWQALAIALGATLGAWLLWIGWSLRRSLRSVPPDALTRAWRRVDARLARAGLARPAHEGVLACAERLARSRPALGARLTPLARRYAQLRFGPPEPDAQLHAFLLSARAFRVPEDDGGQGA
jgi:hypothetical protein